MQAQFSQARPVAITPNVSPRMPLYPLGAPAIGQQFLYGQAAPATIPQVIKDSVGFKFLLMHNVAYSLPTF